MIECCQLFQLKNLANYYLEKAMSLYVINIINHNTTPYYQLCICHQCLYSCTCCYRCVDVQFGVEDVFTYAHLLSVALNSKLCEGRVSDAVEIGKQF